MSISKTITYIDFELSNTLNEYQPWFGLNTEVLCFKPKEGWSIGQILEHVTLTNHYLLILIRKGERKALDLAGKKDLQTLLETYSCNLHELDAIARHNSFDWIRPEHMEPTGDKDLEEVRLLLEEQLKECRDILFEMNKGEGILYKTTMTVNNLGKIDVYQYIYFLCQHAKRHTTQMQKVLNEYNEANPLGL